MGSFEVGQSVDGGAGGDELVRESASDKVTLET